MQRRAPLLRWLAGRGEAGGCVIDVHCHAGRGDRLNGPWDTSAPLGRYLRRARAAGIARTVVFAPLHSDYAAANEEVARIVARHPGRLVGFAFVNPQADAGRIRAMVARAVRLGFRGLKIHGIDGRPGREVCEAAREFGLPVLCDVVGRPGRIELLAPEYPEVDFILPHLGSFADDHWAQQQVVDMLVRLPNVHADTSGVRRFDYLVQAVERAGPRKLLFGSDGPWLHPGLELHKVRLLGLPPADEALVLGGNARRLLWSGRGGRATCREPVADLAVAPAVDG